MRRIFIGMLFIFLDFHLDFGGSRLGLIPDFVGYLLMLDGLRELSELSDQFARITRHARGMAAYSAVLYVLDLLGITPALGPALTFVLGLISTLMLLYISHAVVLGVVEIEQTRLWGLEAEKLLSAWKLSAVFTVGALLLAYIPGLNLIALVLGFIFAIYFLYCLSLSKNRFYQ